MQTALTRSQVYLAGICSLIITVGVARFSYTSLLPVMQSATGLTEAEGGWLATANYMGYMLGVMIAASLHNLHHKYLLHRIYLLMSVVTSAAMVMTTDVFIWSVLRFLAGICASGGLIIASGLILKWLVHNNHRGELGIHFSGIGISIIFVAVLVEGLLQLSANWQQQWLAFAVMAAVLVAPAWLWMPHPDARKTTTTTIKDNPPGRNYTRLFLLAYFCAGYGYVVSATFIVDMVEELPTLEGKGQLAFLLVGIGAAPAVLIWDRVARKLGYLKALLLAYAIEIGAILLPVISHSLGAMIISALLFGATFVACVSLVLTMAGQFYPSNPARFMGKMTLAYGVAQIIAPLCTGYLAQQLGNYDIGLYISAGVMAIGFCLIAMLIRLERRRQDDARCGTLNGLGPQHSVT